MRSDAAATCFCLADASSTVAAPSKTPPYFCLCKICHVPICIFAKIYALAAHLRLPALSPCTATAPLAQYVTHLTRRQDATAVME